MKKPVIAVDVDDVLAASTEALRLEVNQRLGVSLTAEHYKVPHEHFWGYYEHVWELHDLKGKISLDELDPQMKADQSHVPAHDDAHRVLKKLSERYDLVIVTGRGLAWADATHVWLERNFPGIFKEVLLGGGKDGLAKKNKGEWCVELGASWLIDDGVQNIEDAARLGVEGILFGSYGWHYAMPEGAVHCLDWRAVEEYFDGLGS